MDFTIPYGKTSELLLYIWKIINLPVIKVDEFLYELSFNLILLSPEKADLFLNECIKKKFLVKNTKGYLKLSETLLSELNIWQTEKKKIINKNIKDRMQANTILEQIEKNKSSDFGILLKAFSEKSVLNRAIAIPDDSFQNVDFNIEKGRIFANVKGSEREPYRIEIDLLNHSLQHDCHDFIERKSKAKKFCKHLTKFFLFMKSREEKQTLSVLEKLAEEINDWNFLGF